MPKPFCYAFVALSTTVNTAIKTVAPVIILLAVLTVYGSVSPTLCYSLHVYSVLNKYVDEAKVN